jgi:phosphatidylglycerol:prolipoprotein diacylglycerol transferase
VFCLIYRVPFRPVFDVLAISAAIILGFGRVGNFLDGQIHGSLTELPWGVKFPNVDGFRHPVVLYDGLKNFLLVPLLLWLRRRRLPPGRLAAIFVILYSGLRIPIDTFRDYPITTLGLPTGQTLNIIMLVGGLILFTANIYRSPTAQQPLAPAKPRTTGSQLWPRRVMLAAVCILPLVIPSDATRDIPATYGSRHPGLGYSWMYPPIADELKRTDESSKGR